MDEAGRGTLLTIREAAAATGLTPKALRRRIERGSLDSAVVDGRRVLPATELARAGLIGRGRNGASRQNGEAHSSATNGHGHPNGSANGSANGIHVAGEIPAIALLDRLERQAIQLGELRHAALVARRLRTELETVRTELARARARISQLELGR